ncbi:MAG: C40 family peptidase [Tissierellia bacterium]|nr:C40 family peptidase [Tissierellia bacterium]
MEKINIKSSIGVAALCVVGLLGLRDTGIFVTSHTTTLNSGNKLSFEVEEKANIIEIKEQGYIVQKGEAKVTVPKNKIIKVDGKAQNYIVKANAALMANDKVVRNLFLGEKVTLVEDRGEEFVVKAEDGATGLVAVANLEAADNAHITKGVAKKAQTLKNEGKEFKVEKDQVLSIVSFENNNFIVINDAWETFPIPVDQVLLDGKDVPVAEQVTEPKEEKVEEKKAPVNLENVNNEKAKKVIKSAGNKMGVKYVYGATGTDGYDCSGLVYAIYKTELGINVPRTSKSQSQYGTQVDRSQLQPGDLVFFNTTGKGVSHVGIYIGDNNFIHASSGQKKVVKNSLDDKYYNQRYVNATRVL